MNMSRYSTGSIDGTRIVHDWFRFFSTKFVALAVVVGLVTRIVLLFIPPTVIAFTSVEWLKIFGLGFLNDAAFAVFAWLPPFCCIHCSTMRNTTDPSYLILGLLGARRSIPSVRQYFRSIGSVSWQNYLSLLLSGFSLGFSSQASGVAGERLETICDAVRVSSHTERPFRMYLLYEFGARYNFIAVNYLCTPMR